MTHTLTPLMNRCARATLSGVLALALSACGADKPAAPAALEATAALPETMPEKPDLKFGFIKLTDMVPLAIAYEKGYFEDEGLYVTLEAQANWKVLLDRVISGELDGAHMLAGQPLAATIGYGTQAEVITAFSMDLNGNAITVSNEVWSAMKAHVPMKEDGLPVRPVRADALKPVVEQYRADGRPFNLGMVFPVSTHNYELRYWLAAGGIHPGYYAPQRGDVTGQLGGDVLLSVTPPPQMPATLEAGTIFGYCVGPSCEAIHSGLIMPATPGPGFHGSAFDRPTSPGTVIDVPISTSAVSSAASASRSRGRVSVIEESPLTSQRPVRVTRIAVWDTPHANRVLRHREY